MAGEVLSNVIGAPFDPYIIDQLKVRANRNWSSSRTNQELLFLANKMSWTRLSSSVRIDPKNQTIAEFYRNLFDGEIPLGDYSAPDSLAKNWILQAGTSKVVNNELQLRSGLGPNNAYGLGGIEMQGYRPMPGIEGVTIETKGVLGSLREANISFKVWNVVQLNVIEALYFRLGYTMLLEWGHVNYFANNGDFVADTSTVSGLDIFSYKGKEEVGQAIKAKNKQTEGNYDGMLGVVTNFYFSFNQQGGFDCNIKLIGLGSIIDTLRINQIAPMPNAIAIKVREQQELIQKAIEQQEQLALTTSNSGVLGGTAQPLVEVAQNLNGIEAIYKYDTGRTPSSDFVQSISFPSAEFQALGAVNSSVDYYYKAVGSAASELNTQRTGLFLNQNTKRSSWQYITQVGVDNKQPVTLFTGNVNFYSQEERVYKDPSILSFDAVKETEQEKAARKVLKSNNLATVETSNYYDEALSNKNSAVKRFDSALIDVYEKNLYGQYLETNIKLTKRVVANTTYFVTRPTEIKPFIIELTYEPPTNTAATPTREELISALDNWFTNNKIVDIYSIEPISTNTSTINYIKIQGTLNNIDVPGKGLQQVGITFTDTALIDQVLPRLTQADQPIPTPGQTVNSTGDTEAGENQTSTPQGEEATKYSSALHAMLIATKSQGQARALDFPDQAVIPIDLTDNTKIFYDFGVLKGVFSQTDTPGPVDGTPFNLQKYAAKGFNSNLMADPNKYNSIRNVDFKSLSQAYLLKYRFSDGNQQDSNNVEFPVYIKLGYLLAFLNNMCLIYEAPKSKNNADLKPYTYIDFHPDYNFCLTAPQHLTVDPYKVLIPLQATQGQYLELFPSEIRKVIEPEAFNPKTQNLFSAFIGSFKTPSNTYQGRTMEILLNTQYLLELANSFIRADKEGAITFKPFLDAVLNDINKSTGGFNLFRVSYRDDSNTVIIKDDQWVPNLPNEPTIMPSTLYFDTKRYAQLPVYGSGSIVREMEFKTNMSTKMSSLIAISAQSGTVNANSQDGTPLGTYNDNYVDAFMPVKTNSATTGSASNTSSTQEIENTGEDAAKKFNAHIKEIYYGGSVAKAQTDPSIAYYLDRFRLIKSTNPVTTAAPFIPANLSITVDGISGIVMGNAFTIPEDRLPASLRGDNLKTKVGFVVVGLTHTLQQNQWLTKIRGQMIRLRDSIEYGGTAQIGTTNQNIISIPTVITQRVNLQSLNLNADWVSIAFVFIASKEGFLSRPRFDYTRKRAGYGSSNFVTANGEVLDVTDNTVFTLADAERTLRYNIQGPYKDAVIQQIGQAQWERLNTRQKASIVSYVYNAGPGALKTWGIARAIQTNSSAQQVAVLISRGPITAKDIRTGIRTELSALVTRRREEAQLFIS